MGKKKKKSKKFFCFFNRIRTFIRFDRPITEYQCFMVTLIVLEFRVYHLTLQHHSSLHRPPPPLPLPPSIHPTPLTSSPTHAGARSQTTTTLALPPPFLSIKLPWLARRGSISVSGCPPIAHAVFVRACVDAVFELWFDTAVVWWRGVMRQMPSAFDQVRVSRCKRSTRAPAASNRNRMYLQPHWRSEI